MSKSDASSTLHQDAWMVHQESCLGNASIMLTAMHRQRYVDDASMTSHHRLKRLVDRASNGHTRFLKPATITETFFRDVSVIPQSNIAVDDCCDGRRSGCTASGAGGSRDHDGNGDMPSWRDASVRLWPGEKGPVLKKHFRLPVLKKHSGPGRPSSGILELPGIPIEGFIKRHARRTGSRDFKKYSRNRRNPRVLDRAAASVKSDTHVQSGTWKWARISQCEHEEKESNDAKWGVGTGH
eukprot:gene12989-biopygen1823